MRKSFAEGFDTWNTKRTEFGTHLNLWPVSSPLLSYSDDNIYMEPLHLQ